MLKKILSELKGVYVLTVAQNRLSKSEFSEALEMLGSFPFSEEQRTEALIMSGNCSYSLKKYRDAISFYQDAVENEEMYTKRKSQKDKDYLIKYASLYIAAAEMRLGISYSQDDIDKKKSEIRKIHPSKTIALAFSV